MVREGVNAIAKQPTGDKKGTDVADVADEYDFGPNVTVKKAQFDNAALEQSVNRALPKQVAMKEVEASDGYSVRRPTPDNYVAENATVPPFIKKSSTICNILERNAFCRLVGGIGPYFGHRYRGVIMGCASFISFTTLILLIVPLVSAIGGADTTKAFALVKGDLHWKLLIPIDWTQTVYIGLAGMSNVTKKGDPYFVRFDSVECTEVFSDACGDCHTASMTTTALCIAAIVLICPAFCLDLHRIFQFFDLNFSKLMAVILHLVAVTALTVLAYLIFVQQCFLKLPPTAIHNGDGREGIGMYAVWNLSIVAQLMLIVLILSPIPGFLHLLVPTPNWANNRGLKAARRAKKQATMVDPFDDLANSVMQGGTRFDPVVKPPVSAAPVYAVPIPEQSIHSDLKTEEFHHESPSGDSRTVSATSVDPDFGTQVAPEMVRRGTTAFEMPTTVARRDSFVDPFEGGPEEPAVPTVRRTSSDGPSGAGAATVTKKAGKTKKGKGATEMAPTRKM